MELTNDLTIDSRARLETAVSEYAELRRQKAKAEAALNAKIAKLREKHQSVINDFAVEVDAYNTAIEEYALQHADELLAGQKTKTLKLPGGDLKYSKGRRSVSFTAKPEDVCAQLHKAGRGDLVIMSERPDKSAIGKLDVPPVAGVEFVEPQLTVSIVTA